MIQKREKQNHLDHLRSRTPPTKAETDQLNMTIWTQIAPYRPKTSLKPIRQAPDTSTKRSKKLDFHQNSPPNPATVPPNSPSSASSTPPHAKQGPAKDEHTAKDTPKTTQTLRLSGQKPSPETKSRGNGVQRRHQTGLGQKRPARHTAPRNDERTTK